MAKTLRDLREEALLTQIELAEKVGVAYQRIGEWERGQFAPRTPTRRKLCEAFGISPAELVAALRATQEEAVKGEAAA